jgi:AcrR family transcriptional regulator
MPASLVSSHPSVQPHLGSVTDRQRARMLDAITTVVADKGYVAATVADVVRSARVSRRTFYEQFASKEECFLESYRYGIEVLVERIQGAAREAAPAGWRAELHAGVSAYLDVLASEPRFARTHMLELHAAGARAQSARDDALRRFAAMYRRTFEAAARERGGLAPPTDEMLFILAAGVDQLVCARVREAKLERLPELEDAIGQAAEALLEGAVIVNRNGSA